VADNKDMPTHNRHYIKESSDKNTKWKRPPIRKKIKFTEI